MTIQGRKTISLVDITRLTVFLPFETGTCADMPGVLGVLQGRVVRTDPGAKGRVRAHTVVRGLLQVPAALHSVGARMRLQKQHSRDSAFVCVRK